MIFDEIKFIFQKIMGAKYKISGKCKQCGKCCSEIIFVDGNRYVATKEYFELMKKFDKGYNNFEISITQILRPKEKLNDFKLICDYFSKIL